MKKKSRKCNHVLSLQAGIQLQMETIQKRDIQSQTLEESPIAIRMQSQQKNKYDLSKQMFCQ